MEDKMVRIGGDAHRKAKIVAAHRDITIRELVERAIDRYTLGYGYLVDSRPEYHTEEVSHANG